MSNDIKDGVDVSLLPKLTGESLERTCIHNFAHVPYETIRQAYEDFRTLQILGTIINGMVVDPWIPLKGKSDLSLFFTSKYIVEDLIKFFVPNGEMDELLKKLKPSARQLNGDSIREKLGISNER